MTSPNDRITHNGITLSRRVWALLADAYKAAGLKFNASTSIGQGSWSHASASAGTHSGGGAFDARVSVIPEGKWLVLVNELRKRNVAAWLRSPKYGWTSTGPHIHGIVKDEPGLSDGARQQVDSYNRGRNGLANDGRDPFERPVQHPFVMAKPKPVPISVGPGKAPFPGFVFGPGAHGAPVSELQRGLRRHGHPDIKVTGIFDAATAKAVIEYKKKQYPWLIKYDKDGPLVGINTYRSVTR